MSTDLTQRQIEAAAEAIQQAFANWSGRASPWAELPERTRARYRDEARAALNAAEQAYHAEHLVNAT